MSIRAVSVLCLASFFVGCAAQTPGDEANDPQSIAEAGEALSSLGKLLVGSYQSDALYPRFTIAKDGTYTWDTGIRCVKAPCPSGDAGKMTLYSSYSGTLYVDLLASDDSAEHWLRIDSLNAVKLTGVWGTTGTFKQVATGGCTENSQCQNGEQCLANACTPRPLCVQVTTADGAFHARSFAPGSYSDADAWGAATAKGNGYGISLATCTEVSTNVCSDPYGRVCAFISGTDAASTYGSACLVRNAVMAAAGDYGQADGISHAGSCTSGAPKCATYSLSSDSTSSAYYAHDFGSQFEAEAWTSLVVDAKTPSILDGKCSDYTICSALYNPVCGGVKSETMHTYSNLCAFQAAVRKDATASVATGGWSKGRETAGACH